MAARTRTADTVYQGRLTEAKRTRCEGTDYRGF
jgi:hypothetical protein